MTGTPIIDRATPGDLDDILALLRRSHLPVDGFADHLPTAVVARIDGRIVGSAALEVYADGALLRSVAVDAGFRGRGIGAALTTAAIQLAEQARTPAVFLLTTTAEHYFPRNGFTRIGRSAVPSGVRGSVEFTSACPSSAIVMQLRLDRETRSSPS